MGFRYELKTADGADAGTFETAAPDWWVGDIFRTDDGRWLRITAIEPMPVIQEFLHKPTHGLWEVEPL